jgi:hypothetical protein
MRKPLPRCQIALLILTATCAAAGGVRRAFRDKGLTEGLAAKLEREKRLAKRGLLDPREVQWAEAEQRPLREHVEDWAADLRAARRTEQHVKLCNSRVLRLLRLTGGGANQSACPVRLSSRHRAAP